MSVPVVWESLLLGSKSFGISYQGAFVLGAFVLNVRFRVAKRTKLLKSPAASLASTFRSMRNRYAASAIGVLRCVDRCNNESSVC